MSTFMVQNVVQEKQGLHTGGQDSKAGEYRDYRCIIACKLDIIIKFMSGFCF